MLGGKVMSVGEDWQIDKKYLDKWQNIVDTLAELMNIEDALITRVSKPEVEVLKVYNKEKSDPLFEEGDQLTISGHYCEEVINKNQRLIVSDAEEKDKNYAEEKQGLISYIGFPIRLPNGEIFGTICVHDKSKRVFKQNFVDLMGQYRELVESHLKTIYKNGKLENKIEDKRSAEKKYKQISNRLNTIYENIQQGLCLHEIVYKNNTAVDYRILNANRAYTEILDISQEKAVGSLGSDLYNSEEPPFLDKYVKTAETGQPQQFEEYYAPMDIYFNITVTSPEKGKFITLFSDITEQKEREQKIKDQQEKVLDLNERLSAYNEEVVTINEELEESLIELDKLNKRFTEMIDLVSDIENKKMADEKEFFSDLLARAVEIVPEADYGKICIKDEAGRCNFIDAIGHDLEKLKQVKLKTSWLSHYKGKGVFQSKGYFIDISKMPKSKQKVLNQALKPVKESLYINITVDDQLVGRIGLDIKEDSNSNFTDTTKKIIKSFATLSSTFFSFKRLNRLKTNFTKELITSIIKMVEMYDYYTKGHSENVARLGSVIAEKMNLSNKVVQETYWTGLVHDIGKLLVPIHILNKEGKLNDKEYSLVQKHPVWGSKALKNSESLQSIARQVRYHHERWDGNGYPEGLKENEIPLISQIIALADAWDAMLSQRSYRDPLSKVQAIQEIKENKGKQFSPQVVDTFLKLYNNNDLEKLKEDTINYSIEQKNKKKRLSDYDISFETLFREANEGIVILDNNFNIQKTNQYFEEMFGYSEKELQGKNIKTIVHAHKYQETENYIEKLIEKGEISSRTYRKKKSGEQIEVSIEAFPLSLESENLGYYVIYRDITELKNIEKEYKEVKDRYKSLFNNKYTVMLIINPENGKIVDANPAAEKFYGWEREVLTSMKIMEINKMDSTAVKREMRKANRENKLYFDFKHKTAYGEIKDVEVYSQPIKFGSKQYLYSIIHDVTDRNQIDKKLKKQRDKFKELLTEMGNNIPQR